MTGRRHAGTLPAVFDICTPREDVRKGIVESDLAADLAHVVKGDAPREYADPAEFFASTYPTRGIKGLLRQVLTRLGGRGSPAVFWLNTSFGGGKTHALIALLHAVRSPADTPSEFADAGLLPKDGARMAVFDGENADISGGHRMGDGVSARTPWGEIAYGLAGESGYRRVDDSVGGSAPGADTIRDLLGDGPVLVLLDELAVYLRKAQMHEGAGGQLAPFLTALIKAVEGSPRAALVYTLAAGREDDAYSDENRRLVKELESVSSRKATLLNPTEEDETIHILRRRLFERRDESRVNPVVDAYVKVWKANRDRLPDTVDRRETVDRFRAGYPLHPDILHTLVSKTSTLENFQRVRGMLRLLGHVVHDLWKRRDKIRPAAIHLHHFDMGNEDVRQEITTRLGQDAFAPAIDVDIASDDAGKTSKAQALDERHYSGLPPFTMHVARAVFMHTLAYNGLRGIDDRDLRYSILSPGMEVDYVDEALDRFRRESLYLDDDLEKPTQFRTIPNLNSAIQQERQKLDDSDLEGEMDRRIKETFRGGEFDPILFPNGHEDVPDDRGRPKLVVLKYGRTSTSNPEAPPGAVRDMFQHKGIGGGLRMYRNNLVFLVAYDGVVGAMYGAARDYIAMSRLAASGGVYEFADYQKEDIKKRLAECDAGLDRAILDCHRYVYYPGKGDRPAYVVMQWRDGGQRELLAALRDKNKVRAGGDLQDSPESLMDRIAGLRRGRISTLDFRDEFYRSAALPMLIGDGAFEDGILKGIDAGVFVYESGELLCGKGDPHCAITIDADSAVYTVGEARRRGIWPRRKRDNGGGEGDGHEDDPIKDPSTLDLSSVRHTGKPSAAVRTTLDELRKHNVDKISQMRMESENDIFPLLSVIGRIRQVEISLKIEGDYEANGDSSFRFEFDGALRAAGPVLEFLKPQMRQASVGNIRAALEIKFEAGITVGWLETLADGLRLVGNEIEISGLRGATA